MPPLTISFRVKGENSYGEIDFKGGPAEPIASKNSTARTGDDYEIQMDDMSSSLLSGRAGIHSSDDMNSSSSPMLVPDTYNMPVDLAAVELDESADWWTRFYASVGEKEVDLGEKKKDPEEDEDEDEKDLGLVDTIRHRFGGGEKKRPGTITDLMQHLNMPLEKAYHLEHVVKPHDPVHGAHQDKAGADATIKSFVLVKGKTGKQDVMGIFKGDIRVLPLESPRMTDPMGLEEALRRADKGQIQHPWGNLPSSASAEVLVRVYIVRGIHLQPRDSNGKSDPFVVLSFGKGKTINDKANYIARNLDPEFGRVFEMTCVIPEDNELRIQVYDYDMIGSNDLIGETKIDLEARYLTRKRATVGLPRHYKKEGFDCWRDSQKPSDILEKFCKTHHLPKPTYTEWIKNQPVSCTVNGRPFTPADEKLYSTKGMAIQNAALMALHSVGLVREHIETRALYDPMQPGLEQGKIQMWIDMFPKEDWSRDGMPKAIDITPRKPKKFVLRVVILNTKEVDFADHTIHGEDMSDIYVKTEIEGLEDKSEKTDVHYRSLNHEGNFNWRNIHEFGYIPATRKVVVTKRAHLLTLEKEDMKHHPILKLQIWDANMIMADQHIGSYDIDLTKMFLPPKKSSNTSVEKQLEWINKPRNPDDLFSIFTKKRVGGWYSCTPPGKGTKCSGKIELEMELLTEEEAVAKPAGRAREDPNKLEPPNRPATSFLWFTSPWKTFRFIVWRNYKWYIIGIIILIILIIAIVLFFYAAPPAVMQKIVNGLDPKTT